MDNEEDGGLFQYLIKNRMNSVCYIAIVDKKLLPCQCCVSVVSVNFNPDAATCSDHFVGVVKRTCL